MKKILFASTALIASAGIAAADVSVSGDGRMGVYYNADPAGGFEKFGFTSRIRITFRASGETDGGLQFGGSIRADNAGGSGGGSNGQSGNVFISGDFGRISMGDVDGAAEYVVGDLHFRSLLAGSGGAGTNTDSGAFTVHETTYLANSTQSAMRYDYSMGDFTFALSADQPGAGDEVFSIGAAYDAGMFGIALGHERDNVASVNHTIAALTASVDGVADFKAIYGRASGGQKQYGISASASFDATTVMAFARRSDVMQTQTDYFGVGGSYDLGGGASIRAGFIHEKPQGGSSTNRADFGVAMSF